MSDNPLSAWWANALNSLGQQFTPQQANPLASMVMSNPVGTQVVAPQLINATPIDTRTVVQRRLDDAAPMATTMVLGMAGGDSPGMSLVKRSLPKSYIEAHGLNANDHLFDINRPDGRSIGTIHINYDPDTQTGRIISSYVGGGANFLGMRGAIRLRSQLQSAFPNMKVLSGERVSGANPDRDVSINVRSKSDN